MGDGFRSRNLTTRLHAGEAAEPGKLHLVIDESRHRRGVALNWEVLNGDPELALQIVSDAGEALDQTRLVLVRNRREYEGRLILGERSARCEACGQRNRC